jgi:hypothetical protein
MLNLHRYSLLLSTCAFLVSAMPAIAQTSSMDLARGFDRTAATSLGTTGGDVLLQDLAQDLSANVPSACQSDDRYTSEAPNHLINLSQDLLELLLTVNSDGKETTLMVQDPEGRLYCGTPGSGFNEDSVLEMTHWDAGTYKVWVSGAAAGQQYRLSARE